MFFVIIIIISIDYRIIIGNFKVISSKLIYKVFKYLLVHDYNLNILIFCF